VWVKICGITRLEDALAASALGADAVGFVFTQSPRRVAPDDLKPWIGRVEGVEKVAVFAGEPVEEIIEVCSMLSMDTVQIHARPAGAHERLARSMKVIFAMKDYEPGLMPDYPCRILIDPSMGRGTPGLWRNQGIPYILAGGLTPENVSEAVRRAGPRGVDVSSGVESAPGIKDALKMERFIKEARS
jgi:phosphoribosylanthranilate isomerase